MSQNVQSLTSLGDEARQAVAAAFDALSHWRNEIFAANDRCLTKVLDRVAAAHRALGWPDHVTAAAKEHFLKASKMQSHMIDQAMDAWHRQLRSENARSGVPGFVFQTPLQSQSAATPVSEMLRFGEMTFAPFKLWIEAAETWQRSWMAVMSGGAMRGPPWTTDAQPEPSSREGRSSRL